MKNYSELIKLPTFSERFQYLSIGGEVGKETFGYERYLNQKFYKSKEWRDLRNYIIVRDKGCDMALDGYEIPGRVIIHHMNPIGSQDITSRTEFLMNPEYLVCVSYDTHNAIHYGNEQLITLEHTVRIANDTCPWR